jgi:hypothetical protein
MRPNEFESVLAIRESVIGAYDSVVGEKDYGDRVEPMRSEPGAEYVRPGRIGFVVGRTIFGANLPIVNDVAACGADGFGGTAFGLNSRDVPSEKEGNYRDGREQRTERKAGPLRSEPT